MQPITDPVLIFTVLIAAMFIAPLLAVRLRVPDLVLLLAAGAALGPNGLNVLAREGAVELFGTVGLLYIMFIAGLEIDLHRFARSRNRTILFGILTFALPQGLGTLAGRYVLGLDWMASTLLASMFASHTLLAYPLASRLGISRTEPVTVTVGATLLTDTLALLVLAVVAASARGDTLGPEFWASLAVGMAVLVAIAWWGIPPVTRWFFENVTESGGAQFLFVLAMVCGFAYLSHFARLEPIIGAFLAGVAFNRLIPEHSVLMNRVSFVGNTLFIPFFLLSVGMLVDLGALVTSPRSWLVAATMVAMVVITKYLAAWVAGKASRYDSESVNVMFGLSVVQAAATLAAVLVGYRLGVFDESVLNGTIAMIAVTCPLGSWAVDRYGRKLASQTESRERAVTSLEQRVLVSVANPAFARRLMELAFVLRDLAIPGAIHPVTIVRDDAHTEENVARGEKLLAHCLTQAAAADIPVNPSVRVDMNVPDGIVRATKELRSSQVLVGWESESSLSARLLGTVREKLLGSCPARLLMCRLVHPLNTTKSLVVPLPPLFERRVDRASFLRDAKHLARQIGAKMRVYLPGEGLDQARQAVEAARPSCPLTFVESGTPAEARNRLFEDMDDGDTVLVPAERRSSALWTPTLDKLPKLLAVRFPENNLMVAYPAVAADGSGEGEAPEGFEADHLVLCPVDLETGTGLAETLRRMVNSAFPRDKELADHAHELLLTSANSYPLDLSAGAVLLHAHCEGLDYPVVIVGLGRDSLEFASLQLSARLILTLLSPKDESPTRHLKALAGLARRFHDPDVSARIADAPSASAICRLLEGAEE